MNKQGSELDEEATARGAVQWLLWKQLWMYVRAHTRVLWALAACAVVTAAMEICYPLITRAVIDTIEQGGTRDELWRFAFLYAMTTIVVVISIGGFIRVGGLLQSLISHDIRRDGVCRLQELSFSYFNNRPVGWLMARMTADCDRLSNILVWGFLDTVWGISIMIGISVAMIWLNPVLAAVVLSVLPVLAIASFFFQHQLLHKEHFPISNSQKTSSLQTWEKHIHAFVDLCPLPADSTSKPADQPKGNLNGITVGIKDIIDVKGVPTRNGSNTCHDAEPAIADASVVASLRCAGASIIGKTTTTEFAFTDPTDCRNPYDLTRTPGGSSSGSGAAVAAGMVDMALGTQTAGSLCRPAAYCGVVGLKPTYGVLPTTGVTPLAKSFDTVGIIAKSVDIVHKGFVAIVGSTMHESQFTPTVARVLLPTQTVATEATLDAFHAASSALDKHGINVDVLTITTSVSDIVSAHRTVMNSEAAHAHRQLLHPDSASLLRPKFRAALVAGAKVSATELEQAQGLLSLAKEQFWLQLTGVDIILTLPVPDAAPLMDGTTGFQDWLTPWTVFAGPLVCLPWGLDKLGRPKSIMLAAHPGQDMQVLAMAKHLEQLAPMLPRPTPPAYTASLRSRN